MAELEAAIPGTTRTKGLGASRKIEPVGGGERKKHEADTQVPPQTVCRSRARGLALRLPSAGDVPRPVRTCPLLASEWSHLQFPCAASLARRGPQLADTRVVALRYARGHAGVAALVPFAHPNPLRLEQIGSRLTGQAVPLLEEQVIQDEVPGCELRIAADRLLYEAPIRLAVEARPLLLPVIHDNRRRTIRARA